MLKNLESHRQTFQQIHKDRSVNGVPVPPEQLQDMAERSDIGTITMMSREFIFCVVLL